MALSAVCPIHDTQMFEKEGQYGSFWSHKTEDPDYAGSNKGYCNGKPPKNMANFGSAGYQQFKQVGEAIAHRPAPEIVNRAGETREPVQQTDWAEKDRRISRMSCQKQAIETMRLLADFGNELTCGVSVKDLTQDQLLAEIKELTDWFAKDLDQP